MCGAEGEQKKGVQSNGDEKWCGWWCGRGRGAEATTAPNARHKKASLEISAFVPSPIPILSSAARACVVATGDRFSRYRLLCGVFFLRGTQDIARGTIPLFRSLVASLGASLPSSSSCCGDRPPALWLTDCIAFWPTSLLVQRRLLWRHHSSRAAGGGRDVAAYARALRECRDELAAFIDQQNCHPIMIRLAWHDSGTYDKHSGTGGADGSIRFEAELAHGANAGLVKAVRFLAPFRAKHSLLSWADVIQLASAVAIELAGGPKLAMRYGRLDAPAASADGRLPAALHASSTDAAAHLRAVFHRMGFSDQEIVALSGAHTLGRAFHDRSGVVPERAGAGNGTRFTSSPDAVVRRDGHAGVGMPGGRSWTTQWLSFDNAYFKRFANDAATNDALLWLPTDQALFDDPDFRPFFQLYALDNERFKQDYAVAHVKLSELGARFDPPEGILIA